MNLSNTVMILAVLFSPFLAVFAQRKIDLCREKRGHRLWIFRTLMATRGNKISLEHVQALNSIELFFDNPKKDKNIVEKSGAWYSYGKERIGQGRENSRTWLTEHPDTLAEIEAKLMDLLKPAPVAEKTVKAA